MLQFEADFRKIYATEKTKNWCEEIIKLSEFAKTQPHAAYSAFCHGEIHKFTYFLRTISGMQEYIKPLDHLITNKFIPTLLQAIITDQDRVLYSLPVKARRFRNTNFIRNIRNTLRTFEISISTSCLRYYHARISNTRQ